MKPIHVHVVAAEPGHSLVIEDEGDRSVFLSDAVIAWRIETHENAKGGRYSECIALTVDGDMPANCCGVQRPDLTITVFSDATYSNLEELQSERKRQRA